MACDVSPVAMFFLVVDFADLLHPTADAQGWRRKGRCSVCGTAADLLLSPIGFASLPSLGSPRALGGRQQKGKNALSPLFQPSWLVPSLRRTAAQLSPIKGPS